MATLKELSDSISSIQSIRKLTSAMETVSVVKLKRARIKLKPSQMAFNEYCQIAKSSVQSFDNFAFDVDKSNDHLWKAIQSSVTPSSPKESEKTLLIAFSPDKSLCGGVNTFLYKNLKLAINDNPNWKILPVGKKITSHCKKYYTDNAILSTEFTIGEVNDDIKNLYSYFDTIVKEQGFTKIVFLYTHFVSSMVQDATLLSLSDIICDKTAVDYEWDGGLESILNSFVPDFFYKILQYFVAQSVASEHAARVVAMKNAYTNAGESHRKLVLQYNKQRQNKITSELLDIVSGKEAMKKNA